jgi:polyhydroxyalkanoate synthesis regulator phasin
MGNTAFDKGLNLGLGAVAFTREKAEKAVNELIDKGKISREDSPAVLEQVVNTFSEESKAWQERLESVVQDAVQQTGVASKQDVEELKAQLNAISMKLDEVIAQTRKSDA